MVLFNEDEKRAITQCFWQLLSAKPLQEENLLISELTSEWNLGRGGWMYTAIQQDPYLSFACVAKMEESKKEEFKRMVIEIVECKGNNDFKVKIATTLFEKTDIQYAITSRNQLIRSDKGNYQIL